MNEKHCGNCIHYRWIEDGYDDGTYIPMTYCDDDPMRDCECDNPACEFYKECL